MSSKQASVESKLCAALTLMKASQEGCKLRVVHDLSRMFSDVGMPQPELCFPLLRTLILWEQAFQGLLLEGGPLISNGLMRR